MTKNTAPTQAVAALRPRPLKGHVLFDILTRGTYRTFTRAIKEAVSNSYDADANSVQIVFEPKQFLDVADPSEVTIQIRDDGTGMSLVDFWDRFASIESRKDPKKKDASTKRYPIGQFGIGSFALVPFSLKVTIYSKKYKEKPIKCELDCPQLLAKTGDDYADHVANNIAAQEITEDEWDTVFGCDESGTVIVIDGVTEETFEELVNGTGAIQKNEERHLFPGAPFTSGLKEIAWELSTLLPLEYAEDEGGIAADHRAFLESNNPGIEITLSEEKLERRIYSKPGSTVATIDHTDKETGVHARGVIIAIPNGAVQPRRANGVLIRLNNIGIGEYRLFNLVGQATIRAKITGEIHIIAGLYGKLNAARDNFTGAAFDALRDYLDKELVKLHNRAYTAWDKQSKRKKDTRKRKTEQSIKKVFVADQKAAAAAQKRAAASAPPAPAPPPLAAAPKGGKAAAGPPPPAAPPPRVPSSPAPAAPTANSAAAGATPPPNGFHDPVTDVQGSKGKVRFDDTHALFAKYSRQVERETIEVVLAALKLACVPDEVYQRIIGKLILLKS